MESLYSIWKRTPTSIRKPLVGILGALVIILGIILMPLPGPGMVIVIIGVSILASEFTWAHRIYKRIMVFVRKILAWLEKLAKRLRKK